MFLKKPKKQLSLKALDAKLWSLTSIFVRRRDAGKNEWFRCVTCERPVYIKDGHAGHFINRDKKIVKFDLRNVSGQCVHCNSFKSGRQFEHGVAIDKKWGHGTAADLLQRSKMVYHRRTRVDFLVQIQEMEARIKKQKEGL